MTFKQGAGIFILLLAPCLCFTAFGSYQYRNSKELSGRYDLQLDAETEAAFVSLASQYGSYMFSDPAKAELLVQNSSASFSDPVISLILQYWEAKTRSARSEFEQALTLVTDLDTSYMNPSLKGDVLILKGRLHKDLGNVQETLRLFLEAERLFIATNDLEGLAIVYVNFGEVFRYLPQYDRAMDYLDKAGDLNLLVKFSDPLRLYFWNRKAAVFNETKQMDSAAFYSQKIIDQARAVGNFSMLAASLNELGLINENRGQLGEALQCYLEALALWKASDNPRYWTNVISHVARMYIRNGDLLMAEKYLMEGLPEAEAGQWYSVLYVYYDLLATIAFEQGRHMEVFTFKDKAKNAQRLEFDQVMNKELAIQQARMETHTKQMELDLSVQKIQIAEQQRKWAIVSGLGILISAMILLAFYVRDRRRQKQVTSINEKLQNALERNQSLLKDVHHRIKNNLSILIGLVHLQERKTLRDAEREGFLKIKQRLEAMALVHARLIDYSDKAETDFVEILHDLRDLICSSPEGRLEFQLNINVKTSRITSDKAVLLGVILNELMTNSLKYGVEKNGDGFIRVDYTDNEENVVIEYSDSGKGLDAPDTFENGETIGFSLMKMMTRQLRGSIEYHFEKKIFSMRIAK